MQDHQEARGPHSMASNRGHKRPVTSSFLPAILLFFRPSSFLPPLPLVSSNKHTYPRRHSSSEAGEYKDGKE